MGPQFFQTGYGRKFFDADLPRIIKALEKIAVELEKYNEPKIKLVKKCSLDHLAEFNEGSETCPECGIPFTGPGFTE